MTFVYVLLALLTFELLKAVYYRHAAKKLLEDAGPKAKNWLEGMFGKIQGAFQDEEPQDS